VTRTARALLALLTALALTLSLHAPADAARKPKSPDGSYEGNVVPAPDNALDQVFISFDVARKGRKVKNFVVTMNVICVSYPYNDIELVTQPMNDMRINERGKFRDVVEGTTDDGSEYRIEVTGRLKGRAVKQGTLSYEAGVCVRGNTPGDPLQWEAQRTGR
jgi:hypothetical protein